MVRRPYRAHGYPHQQTNGPQGPNGTYPGRRNPGAQRHTPPKRAPGPEWMYRPARIRPHRVPGPPRVSPWAMIRRPYRAHGYPHQQTKRASGPEWDVPGPPRVPPWAMIRRPYRAHGYPHQQTKRAPRARMDERPGTCIRHRWWRLGGVFNTPLHGYPPQQTNGPQGPNKPTIHRASGPNKPTSTGPLGP